MARQTQKTASIFVAVSNTNTFSFVNLSNISDSVVIRDSIQYRSFEVTSLKVLDAGVGA